MLQSSHVGRQSDEGEVTSIKILSSSTLINCSHFTVISNDQLTTCVNTVSALYCHQYLFCLAGQNCIMRHFNGGTRANYEHILTRSLDCPLHHWLNIKRTQKEIVQIFLFSKLHFLDEGRKMNDPVPKSDEWEAKEKTKYSTQHLLVVTPVVSGQLVIILDLPLIYIKLPAYLHSC